MASGQPSILTEWKLCPCDTLNMSNPAECQETPNMTESTARLILTITGTFATICYILAIFFGLRSDQVISIALFLVAIADSAVAYWAYLQYTRLRGDRWNAELRSSEQKMADLLAEESKKEDPKTEMTNNGL